MSSILLTNDSLYELSSEAEGRDLTPALFGQTSANIPRDASALLLRAVGAAGRAWWSKQQATTLVRRERPYLRKNGKDEGPEGLVEHDRDVSLYV